MSKNLLKMRRVFAYMFTKLRFVCRRRVCGRPQTCRYKAWQNMCLFCAY